MTVTIGLVANVYNEVNALPGWLETHLPFFDDVRILHAGPNGEYSNDGTLELLSKWSIPVEFCSINEGFGVVRTKALRMSPCDWVMLLDADERFYHTHRFLKCEGQGTPQNEVDWILQSYDFRGVNLPNWENIKKLGSSLKIYPGEAYNQGNRLKNIVNSWSDYSDCEIDAIVTVRRHWHDLSMRFPTQNWNEHPDWQMRLVRNVERIRFNPDTRMHEQLIGVNHAYRDTTAMSLFFDHFHFTFKKMEQTQRAHDVMIYDAIHQGKQPPTWEQYRSGING